MAVHITKIGVWGVILCSAMAFGDQVKVTPPQVILDQPESTQQLLVSRQADGSPERDVTRLARYRSDNEEIARVDTLGVVRPVKDGKTMLTVEYDETVTRVVVEVNGVDHPRPVSFARDIIPVLTKAGCNIGGCHGKAEGQNGFKLSVFGYDPQADYESLTRQGRGRRVSLAAPDQSLLLRKALASLPHGGGQRLEIDSLRYQRLRRWISEGALNITDAAPELVRIELEPAEAILGARETRQLRVWAIDATGNRRCVTTEAEYESNAPTIAAVDGHGFVQASNIPGEVAVLAKYLGHVSVCRLTLPQPHVQFTRPAEVNFIDRLAWDKLERLGIEPSSLCDDATFLRRAFLDVTGTLPTAQEARTFLADSAQDKRAKLVDTLLNRDTYADYWTMRFSDLLRVDQGKITPAGSVAMTRWLRRQFAENRPYDAFVRDLLLAKGNMKAEGPAAYYKALDTPELLARSVSQVFLGVRIECAQCHHHPSDRWSQEDYYAMAGLFSGLTRKKLADGGEAVVPGVAQNLKHPRTGVPIPAKALGAEAPLFGPFEDRRLYLSNWMTAESNPYFAKMIANRLWAHYFGRGLVEQVDDLRTTNPATNEPLLEALAEHLRSVRYDLKAFTRTLLASRLYQLSTVTTSSNANDEQNFSHAENKALPAEVLLDAISQVTGVQEAFPGWPEGYRAIQIWDNKLPHYFFRIFGRPVRATVCECERGNEPSIAQALHLMNSPEIMEKIRSRDGLAARLAAESNEPAAIVEELFLTTLARYPTQVERQAALEIFAETTNRRESAEDVLWTLLNTKEFLYNH
jgi:hypothetical protein